MSERCPLCGQKDCCGGTLAAEKAESEYALGFAIEAVERLEAEKAEMVEALETAKQFISNGIELGYIHLPEEGDAALETPAIIDAAIGKARGEHELH